jgi:hypothetical protein
MITAIRHQPLLLRFAALIGIIILLDTGLGAGCQDRARSPKAPKKRIAMEQVVPTRTSILH